jgi:hypothetical protein
VKCERVDWYIVVFDRKMKLICNTNTQHDAFLKGYYECQPKMQFSIEITKFKLNVHPKLGLMQSKVTTETDWFCAVTLMHWMLFYSGVWQFVSRMLRSRLCMHKFQYTQYFLTFHCSGIFDLLRGSSYQILLPIFWEFSKSASCCVSLCSLYRLSKHNDFRATHLHYICKWVYWGTIILHVPARRAIIR